MLFIRFNKIPLLLKVLLPGKLSRYLRRVRDSYQIWWLIKSWERIQPRLHANHPREKTSRVLIVPTDPWTLNGARGDDAMISSIMQAAQDANSEVEIFITTATVAASKRALDKGLIPLKIWLENGFVNNVVNLLKRNEIDVAVVIGGDVIDGYYDAFTATKLLIFLDIASRLGVRATIVGFSFNSTPVPMLRVVLDNIHKDVVLNLRDSISLNRFSKFTSARARLVADSAFILQSKIETQECVEVSVWADSRRALGKTVLAFNIHPMLFRGFSQDKIAESLIMLGNLLAILSKERNISWLMLPHDYRDEHGDDVCLGPIAKYLKSACEDDVHHLAGVHSAAELKAVAGLMDGVIAGRMHLAIAALGRSIPVLAITYQDKFEGLFEHFELPKTLLVSPNELIQRDLFSVKVNGFIDELAKTKKMIEQKIPAITKLSNLNYEVVYKQ